MHPHKQGRQYMNRSTPPNSKRLQQGDIGSFSLPLYSRTRTGAPNSAALSLYMTHKHALPVQSVVRLCGRTRASLSARMFDFLKPIPEKGSPANEHSMDGASPHDKSSLRRLLSKVVSFKDLHLTVQHESSNGSLSSLPEILRSSLPATSSLDAAESPSGPRQPGSRRVIIEQKRLAIILVGLPGRGKTFLCNKMKCYLNWLGHPTAHFNVGQYRRKIKEGAELQDAEFFDHHNPAGRAARERAFELALADMLEYLETDAGQVAILDATNSTQERRNKAIAALRGRVQFIFIENICNDPDILRQNYFNKMLYSPDYKGVPTEQAVRDFTLRIQKYEEVYEPITDRNMHYIKLTDMVTGRGHIDINRISGYLSGKLVFYLLQVCKSGITNARKIWLTRHGESVYNQKALIGGDSSLSVNGRAYADVLPEIIMSRLPKNSNGMPVPVSVWTSTLQRTIQTAATLPFAKLRWKALDEIDAGICDGMTYAEIAEKYPNEFEARKVDKLRYRYPRGESYLDMIARLEPVISEMEREGESIVIVGHQAVLRVIFGYLMAQPQSDIPSISIPLHTVIELTPRPDGTMHVEYIPVPINLSDAANHSMGDVPNTPFGEIAAAAGCSFVQQDGVPVDVLSQQQASSNSTGTTMDAAVVIGDPGLSSKGLGNSRDGSVSTGSSARDMTRMASCSSSSTIAQLASVSIPSSMASAPGGPATSSSGVQPTWVIS